MNHVYIIKQIHMNLDECTHHQIAKRYSKDGTIMRYFELMKVVTSVSKAEEWQLYYTDDLHQGYYFKMVVE